jgi:hypothetical protein
MRTVVAVVIVWFIGAIARVGLDGLALGLFGWWEP